jgi:CubicO group peptidase (beta-lactamase class C family)
MRIIMKTQIRRTIARGTLLGLLALLAFSISALPTAAAPRASAPDFAAIDSYVEAQMQAARIPGLALGIVHGDQVVHLRGFGKADQSGRAVTPQTPFILASVSKPLTALAVMQLVEAGKLDLDAPVQRYIPWFRVADADASARVTVRHLLYHTSGMPEITNTMEAATLEEYTRNLRTVVLKWPVGSHHEYCSCNYRVLGLLVETISGQSFESYMQQHVFAPLQMRHSFAAEQPARQDGLAQGYQWLFGLPVPIDSPYNTSNVPGGYLISSAEDMTHILIAEMNGGRFDGARVVSAAGVTAMQRPGVATGHADGSGYGMGWVSGPVGDVPVISHSGANFSFHSLLLIEPRERWGLVLLTNSNSLLATAASFQPLEAGIVAQLVGRPAPPMGVSLKTLYLIVNVVLLLISGVMLWRLLRLRHWQPARGQPRPQIRWLRQVGLPLLVDWGLPLAFVVGVWPWLSDGLGSDWVTLVRAVPDVGGWLMGIGAVLVLAGAVRVWLVLRALRHAGGATVAQVHPSAMQ